MLTTFAVFLYVYASLPETVVLQEGDRALMISREAFFYASLGTLAVVNLMVFIIARLYSDEHQDFKAWFYGLVVTINFFFIIGLGFLNLLNSGEKFEYTRLGVVIYGSVGLIVLWIVGWPVYLIWKSFSRK